VTRCPVNSVSSIRPRALFIFLVLVVHLHVCISEKHPPVMSTPSGNRFAPVTPDNQSGSVWISSLLCLIYSTLVLVVRGHLRWKMYGTDDWFAAAAVVSPCSDPAPRSRAKHLSSSLNWVKSLR
jgi:hypothetical protein